MRKELNLRDAMQMYNDGTHLLESIEQPNKIQVESTPEKVELAMEGYLVEAEAAKGFNVYFIHGIDSLLNIDWVVKNCLNHEMCRLLTINEAEAKAGDLADGNRDCTIYFTKIYSDGSSEMKAQDQ